MSALQCVKRLWLEERAVHLIAPSSLAQSYTLAQGTEVGRLARAHFPMGVLIRSFGQDALRNTQRALAAGATCLFEAAFVYDDVQVRCDILLRSAEGWEIIEVKAATKMKQQYLHDLAVQNYVLAGCGLSVVRLRLMHINSKERIYPDLSNQFTQVDVTDSVLPLMSEVSHKILEIKQVLMQDGPPDVYIGGHCRQPYDCPAKRHCWQGIGIDSIVYLPKVSAAQLAELQERKIHSVLDIPADFLLTPAQREHVAQVAAGKPQVDRAGIRKMMAKLAYPIYFFDFETCSYAVPRFDGMAPYQQAPFQYSCHVLHDGGQMEHREYLHCENSDPRRAVAESLLKHIGDKGSVVVYYAQFERTVIRSLAENFPDLRPHLARISDRLWDQLDIFRHYYKDPAFRGSNSIKSVLPVVAPELSYRDLKVQQGDDAQAMWAEMVQCQDENAKTEMIDALRAYCTRDTAAMVAIHNVLCRIVDGQ
jgi:hypothetical protein